METILQDGKIMGRPKYSLLIEENNLNLLLMQHRTIVTLLDEVVTYASTPTPYQTHVSCIFTALFWFRVVPDGYHRYFLGVKVKAPQLDTGCIAHILVLPYSLINPHTG